MYKDPKAAEADVETPAGLLNLSTNASEGEAREAGLSRSRCMALGLCSALAGAVLLVAGGYGLSQAHRSAPSAAHRSTLTGKSGPSSLSRDTVVYYEKHASDLPEDCKSLRLDSKDWLAMGYTETGVLCIVGYNYQSRAPSTVKMIKDAVKKLDKQGQKLHTFTNLTIDLGDGSPTPKYGVCARDLAYALPEKVPEDCRTKIIPDFMYYKYVEAGLKPNYTFIVDELHKAGSKPAEKQVCGWIGNIFDQPQRAHAAMYSKSHWDGKVDVIMPHRQMGDGHGRMTMQEEVKQWACMLDFGGRGYSGRVPLLLHSGRPTLLIQREAGNYLDRDWLSQVLPEQPQPWKHYIPVAKDFSDMQERVDFVFGEKHKDDAQKIADNAREFAMKYLTYDYATSSLGQVLLNASRALHKRGHLDGATHKS